MAARILRLLVVVGVAMVLGGCGSQSQLENILDDLLVAESASSAAHGTNYDCPTGSLHKAGACSPCDSYENCFRGSADMQYYHEVLVRLVDEYAAHLYADVPLNRWVFVPIGHSAATKCAGSLSEPNDANNAFYCAADRAVFVGEQFMWEAYDQHGDAAPLALHVHEWAHHLQRSLGILVSSAVSILQLELQADCIVGVWASDEVRGRNRLEADDIEQITSFMRSVGSDRTSHDEVPYERRTHGTSTERVQAFLTGYQEGAAGCMRYVAVPVR